MDPAPAAERVYVPSCYDRVEKFSILTPVPILGCMAAGGLGFGLATAFGQVAVPAASTTTAAALQGVNVANIAYDAFVVIGSLFTCGCYYRIMPKWSFEQNIEKQVRANEDASEIESEVKKHITNYDNENDQVDKTLALAYEKIEGLQKALEDNKSSNIKLSDELKYTVDQFNALKAEYARAEKVVSDSKETVASMIDLSKRMKSNVKSSKVVLGLFKDNNQQFDKGIKNLKIEEMQLVSALNVYKGLVTKEHELFNFLIKVYEDLDNTCTDLKNSVTELSKIGDKMEMDVKQDSENMKMYESLEKKLENLNQKLSS